MQKIINILLKEIEEQRALYGSRTAIKQLKKGNAEKIYIAKDCPKEIEEKLIALNANLIKLELTKEMLKELCKKPFDISVISILKKK